MHYRLHTADKEYALLNIGGEVGELLSLEAKAKRDGMLLTHEQNAKKELGDILWHVAALAADYGFTLEEVALSNINKLSERARKGTIKGSGDDR
jgi:NTP pyrophosphatase (non-canonical NTP hydrolase)